MSAFWQVNDVRLWRVGASSEGRSDQWWGQDERVVARWPVRELNRQHDPAEMIEAMIDVITANNPPYRTVKPAAAEEMVRKEQAETWNRRARGPA